MNSALLGLLAETPIHPGTGRSIGVIDLPVAREAATDYPVLVGSSLKGALRDKAVTGAVIDTDRRFGKADHAGDLLVSDGRLLLLPVRSLSGAYRWVTCPHLVERYRRDRIRAGLPSACQVPVVERGEALTSGKGALFLEEREFTIAGPIPADIVGASSPLLLHDSTKARLDDQVAVLHDDDLAWFVRYGLAVQARNQLKPETKTSGNLWYEETLPPDTVMYALVAGHGAEPLRALEQLFPVDDPYLQAGGNMTVGQGWFAVSVVAATAAVAEQEPPNADQ